MLRCWYCWSGDHLFRTAASDNCLDFSVGLTNVHKKLKFHSVGGRGFLSEQGLSGPGGRRRAWVGRC